MRGLTAAEVAAFLGISAAGVRQVVRRANIQPIGKRGRAKVYDSDEVLRHAGTHDRIRYCTRASDVSH